MKRFSLLALPLALWAEGPQLAVLTLSPHGVDRSDAIAATNALDEAFRRTGTVDVLERRTMDALLKERGFAGGGTCDVPACAVDAGRRLKIDQIVAGSIERIGDDYALSLRRMDVGSGEVLSTSVRRQEGPLDEFLRTIAPLAASDLKNYRQSASRATMKDGNRAYRTVRIGNGNWMAENLDFAMDGSWCYDDQAANCARYGRLYDWFAAKRACPSGWHLPDDGEWEALAAAAGGKSTAGVDLKAASFGGSDRLGIGIQGTGKRMNGAFDRLGNRAYFWSASEDGNTQAWGRILQIQDGAVARQEFSKLSGFGVRCVED
jgi:uncharacterized protein (TIGR02145 family)